MEQKVRNYGAEIERLQAMEAMDAEMSKPVSKPLTGKPMTAEAEKPVKSGRASDAYKKAFWAQTRARHDHYA